jgi:hypothetical protein
VPNSGRIARFEQSRVVHDIGINDKIIDSSYCQYICKVVFVATCFAAIPVACTGVGGFFFAFAILECAERMFEISIS